MEGDRRRTGGASGPWRERALSLAYTGLLHAPAAETRPSRDDYTRKRTDGRHVALTHTLLATKSLGHLRHTRTWRTTLTPFIGAQQVERRALLGCLSSR